MACLHTEGLSNPDHGGLRYVYVTGGIGNRLWTWLVIRPRHRTPVTG